MTRCRSFLGITNKGQIKLDVFVMVADASFALRSSRLITFAYASTRPRVLRRA